jgi:DNA-binding NarL/FixJ family response regulator
MTRVHPHRPLTDMEQVVAEALPRLGTYERVAEELGSAPSTVRVHVRNISGKLPNPDELEPLIHVILWAAHDAWLTKTGVPL